MSIIKKIISILLSLIILLAITTLSAIYVARTFVSGENLVNLAFATTKQSDIKYSEVISEVANNNSIPNIDEYVNDEEIKESLEEMINDTLKYYSGLPDAEKPSTDKIKEIVKNSLKEYEKDTKKPVDYASIDKSFAEIDNTIEQEMESLNTPENENVKKVFNFIYSDKIVTIAIIAIIVSVILIIILERSIKKIISKIIVIAIFNGIGNSLFGVVLEKIFEQENNQALTNILATLKNSFDKIAMISFIIAVIGLIISITLKIIHIIKSKKEKKDIDINNNEYETIQNTVTKENNLENDTNNIENNIDESTVINNKKEK